MLVFLLEEESMMEFLTGLLPRILPPEWTFKLVPHEGKSDLEKSIPRKLRAWRTPGTRFIVVRDQDSGDCAVIKAKLEQSCREAGRADGIVCIACRELEAWFIGDLATVGEVFSVPQLAGLQGKARFRNPDRLGSPSRELMALVPGYGKKSGARALGAVLEPARTYSPSFRYFVRKVAEVAASPEPAR